MTQDVEELVIKLDEAGVDGIVLDLRKMAEVCCPKRLT